MEKGFFLAGELAAAAGVSTDTLRHYERKGVLARPRRAANGYRHYSTDALERIKIVRSALHVGFTLDELARVFGEREKGNAPCREVRRLVSEKIAETEARLTELLVLRSELGAIAASWDERLNETAKGERANLLETFAAAGDETKSKIHQSLLPKFNKRKNQR